MRKNGGSLEDRYVQGTVFPLRVTTVDFLDYFVLILFEGGGGFPDESLHPGHIHALIAANFARDGTGAESWETGEQHNEYDESFFHTPDLSLAGKNLSFEHERFFAFTQAGVSAQSCGRSNVQFVKPWLNSQVIVLTGFVSSY